MDPEVKRYFRRILKSISWSVFWLMMVVGLGLSLGGALVQDGWRWYNYSFYAFAIISFCGLLWLLYRTWKKDFQK